MQRWCCGYWRRWLIAYRRCCIVAKRHAVNDVSRNNPRCRRRLRLLTSADYGRNVVKVLCTWACSPTDKWAVRNNWSRHCNKWWRHDLLSRSHQSLTSLLLLFHKCLSYEPSMSKLKSHIKSLTLMQPSHTIDRQLLVSWLVENDIIFLACHNYMCAVENTYHLPVNW